ncbi:MULTISPECIES: hypothetical protein [unclassified Roseibium]|uniref:hypothetical protein n=1 Tax=unclassified Roseibium TaxID=2629323 RepID=UPI00273F0C55|nr:MULTISPECIES: hypothetical protein [unclassified Roseibium]
MDETTAERMRKMPMKALVKKVTGARDRDYLKLPETEEIWNRLPSDLELWFGLIMKDLEDPLALRCGPIDKSDDGYFEIWRAKRDRYFPETRPGYQPPRDSDETSDDEDGGGSDEDPFSPKR